MAQFDAATAVTPFTFNFNPYVDLSGEVPEPTFGKLNMLRKFVGELTTKAASNLPDVDVEQMTMKARLQLVGQMLNVDNSEDQEAVIRKISEFTTIPQTALKKLPWRHQQALFGALVQEFLNPEAPGTTATS